MDCHNVRLFIWLLISFVACMQHIDFNDALSTTNEFASPIQGGTHASLDAYPSRLGSYKYAVYRKQDNEIIGVGGILSLWKLEVIEGDFSATHISIGRHHGRRGIFLSAGWMVNKEEFHDTYPRMYTSFTTDNSATVCYSFRAECAGYFINDGRRLHTPITNTSVIGGDHILLNLTITQDENTKNWVLHVSNGANNVIIGHWPSRLFGGLNEGASAVEWGGLVFRSELSPGPTPMGSGILPAQSHSRASSIRAIRYTTKQRGVVSPNGLVAHRTDPSVYGLTQLINSTDVNGVHFLYGGPGR